MIWLPKPDHPKTTEFAPAMGEGMGVLPGPPATAGQPGKIRLVSSPADANAVASVIRFERQNHT